MKYSSVRVKTILIVEDEPEIRQICHRVLTSQGYHVDFTTNGVTAEGMLSKEDYDLLLIDIKTPVMNGKDFYRRLEARYPKLLAKVIFTTGDVINNETKDFLTQAGRPFLLKPFAPDELQAIVRENLS